MGNSRSWGRPERTALAGDVPADDAAGVAVHDVADAVDSSLRRLAPDDRVVVAFSGGVDSSVLLDAVVRCRPRERVVAWYVHHGLQPQADAWRTHCEHEAARLGVRFGATHLAAAPRSGNLEAWARRMRYRALWNAVAETDSRALLTAHHADDQLETVLMRLARGSGPAALGAMAPAQRRPGGWLLRPLLSIGRERIVECARERGLAWIDDPMNADTDFLRVALRTRVIPQLAKAAPALRENVLRSAEWLRDSGEALRELAGRDLREAGIEPGTGAIDRRPLAALPAARRDLAVRAWFDSLGVPAARVLPSGSRRCCSAARRTRCSSTMGCAFAAIAIGSASRRRGTRCSPRRHPRPSPSAGAARARSRCRSGEAHCAGRSRSGPMRSRRDGSRRSRSKSAQCAAGSECGHVRLARA